MAHYEHSSTVTTSARELFLWHARPGAFERLIPPGQRIRVVERSGGIADGDRLVLELQLGWIRIRWVAEHRGLEPGRRFCDVQVRGPFKRWIHTHSFTDQPGGLATLRDEIDYELPFARLLAPAARSVRRRLDTTFEFRHVRTMADLSRHKAFASHGAQRIAISGMSGLVGSSLCAFLSGGGHTVLPLVRRQPTSPGEIFWDPPAGRINAAALEGCDAVVHLAGENIAAGRWTDERKRRIFDSRVEGTRLLAEAVASLRRPPRVLLSASAVGYYGDRGSDPLDERSEHGAGFLCDVTRAWESATEPASRANVRVVHLRTGIVLSSRGGALARMLTPFKLGAGGVVGSGRQYMNWVALEDLVGAIHYSMFTNTLRGPVNITAPRPVTNYEFTKTLGRVLHRPTIAPLPAPLVRLLFGEMGEALLLGGARVLPARLQAEGFEFLFPELEAALRWEIHGQRA